jgi:hypothetical protein
MPMLGDLLAAARDASSGFMGWLRTSEPALAQQAEAAAEASGIAPTAFVRAAVAEFARFASEEDWATLTSSMRDSEDPGTICLLAMVHWRLTVQACGAHAHRHQSEGALL